MMFTISFGPQQTKNTTIIIRSILITYKAIVQNCIVQDMPQITQHKNKKYAIWLVEPTYPPHFITPTNLVKCHVHLRYYFCRTIIVDHHFYFQSRLKTHFSQVDPAKDFLPTRQHSRISRLIVVVLPDPADLATGGLLEYKPFLSKCHYYGLPSLANCKSHHKLEAYVSLAISDDAMLSEDAQSMNSFCT